MASRVSFSESPKPVVLTGQTHSNQNNSELASKVSTDVSFSQACVNSIVSFFKAIYDAIANFCSSFNSSERGTVSGLKPSLRGGSSEVTHSSGAIAGVSSSRPQGARNVRVTPEILNIREVARGLPQINNNCYLNSTIIDIISCREFMTFIVDNINNGVYRGAQLELAMNIIDLRNVLNNPLLNADSIEVYADSIEVYIVYIESILNNPLLNADMQRSSVVGSLTGSGRDRNMADANEFYNRILVFLLCDF